MIIIVIHCSNFAAIISKDFLFFWSICGKVVVDGDGILLVIIISSVRVDDRVIATVEGEVVD